MATSGDLIHLMSERVPPKDINGRFIDGVFQPSGGACKCQRCRDRIPNDGFYRATTAEHEKNAAEQKTLREALQAQGAGPER